MVTILTTSRNRREFLRKAMDSVLASDYESIEHIVADANSSDGTKELLKEYEKKYEQRNYRLKWLSEPDSGQAQAMNKGLRMATGEFVSFLNDDDAIAPTAVLEFVNVFIAHPKIDFVYGDNDVVYPDGSRRRVSYRLYSLDDMVNRGYQIPQPSVMFRRSLLEKTGLFDESLRHVAEHDLFMRFAESGAKFYYFPHVMGIVTEHPGRATLAFSRRCLLETKMVNFRHGASHFSRFYLLYLRDRYFNGFFTFLRERMPGLFTAMKKIFNTATKA
jgi:glycosyltransferase involved in cell wall biosynthesis